MPKQKTNKRLISNTNLSLYRKYHSKSLVLYLCPNIDYSIVNVIISKKIIKSSVERNKYKRRLREVIRSFYHDDLLGRQVVIYVTKNIIGLDYWDIKKELGLIIKKFKNEKNY